MFDNTPILRLTQESQPTNGYIMNYDMLQIGELISVEVTDVNDKGIGVKISPHIRGFIPLHQIANIALH